jgi:hypothetical protein
MLISRVVLLQVFVIFECNVALDQFVAASGLAILLVTIVIKVV